MDDIRFLLAKIVHSQYIDLNYTIQGRLRRSILFFALGMEEQKKMYLEFALHDLSTVIGQKIKYLETIADDDKLQIQKIDIIKIGMIMLLLEKSKIVFFDNNIFFEKINNFLPSFVNILNEINHHRPVIEICIYLINLKKWKPKLFPTMEYTTVSKIEKLLKSINHYNECLFPSGVKLAEILIQENHQQLQDYKNFILNIYHLEKSKITSVENLINDHSILIFLCDKYVSGEMNLISR